MGNMLMVLVFGMLVAAGNFMGNRNAQIMMMMDNSVGFYEEIQSRNIAYSIIAIGKRKLVDDPNWRSGYHDFPLDGGIVELDVRDSLTYVILDAHVTYGSTNVNMKAVYKHNFAYAFTAMGDGHGHNHNHSFGHIFEEYHGGDHAHNHGHDCGTNHPHIHEGAEGAATDIELISWWE